MAIHVRYNRQGKRQGKLPELTPVAENEDPILAEEEPEQGKVVIPKEIYSITEGEAIDMIMPSYYDENNNGAADTSVSKEDLEDAIEDAVEEKLEKRFDEFKEKLLEELMERIKRSSDDEDDPSPPRKKIKPIRHVEHSPWGREAPASEAGCLFPLKIV